MHKFVARFSGFFMAAIALLLVTSTTAFANPASDKTTVMQFYEAFNTRNFSLLNRCLSNDWEDIPLAPGQATGREGAKPAFQAFFAIFPDFKAETQDVIAQGDRVVVRAILSRTHRGRFLGVDATGKPIKIQAIDIHQMQNGKITRTWHVEDWATALGQIGFLK